MFSDANDVNSDAKVMKIWQQIKYFAKKPYIIMYF